MVQHCSFALPRHFEFNLEKNIEEIACCVREEEGEYYGTIKCDHYKN